MLATFNGGGVAPPLSEITNHMDRSVCEFESSQYIVGVATLIREIAKHTPEV